MNAPAPAAKRRALSIPIPTRASRPRRARATFYAVGDTAPTHAGTAGILAAHRSGLLEHFPA